MITVQNIISFITSFLNFCKAIIISKRVSYDNSINNNEIVILANGPSLSDSIQSINFNNSDFLAVNMFCTTEYFNVVKPKYYMISAPEFWEKADRKEYIEMQQNFEKNLKNKVDWDLILFMPFKAKKFGYHKKIQNLNEKILVKFYNDSATDGLSFLDKVVMRFRFGMPRPHNVLIPSLMMAIWLGYKKILVYGADHSWMSQILVDENNKVFLNQKHFYDFQKSKFEPMYLGGRRERKLHEILHKFYLSFKSYHIIQDWASSLGVKIINKTTNSFIDAFDRR